jgi:hypothetical protein
MTKDDLQALGANLARIGAPILGGALGGPAGAALAPVIVGALCDALGLPAGSDAQAVITTIDANPQASAAAIQSMEATKGAAIRELEARLADTANARGAQIEYVKAGAATQWAPVVVTAIVLGGFAVFSYLAMNAAAGTKEREIVVWLLGSWQTLAGMAVSFWLGSSSASKAKDETLAALSGGYRAFGPVAVQPSAIGATAGKR